MKRIHILMLLLQLSKTVDELKSMKCINVCNALIQELTNIFSILRMSVTDMRFVDLNVEDTKQTRSVYVLKPLSIQTMRSSNIILINQLIHIDDSELALVKR